jgi:hypothetical protein
VGGCVQEKDVGKVEKNMIVDFPKTLGYGFDTSHTAWYVLIERMIDSKNDAKVKMLVYPKSTRGTTESIMALVYREVEKGINLRKALDVLEHDIFNEVGQVLEFPVILRSGAAGHCVEPVILRRI